MDNCRNPRMIESIPAPPHVAAFRFSGQLSGEDYDRCIATLEAHLAEYRRIGVFTDLRDMTGLSAEALAKDLRYAVQKLGEYSRFARAAVVTDKQWLGRISELAGHLLPATEVRAFEPAEAGQALAWAAEVTPESNDPA
ncbi:STAS/SEC14 domain-containing protein [Pseudoxanthomonas sp.]|uniref:STAS/SEC14 domain-containing protein n=1 Tax=Pseudoxanthomonas sp. TaxID=1871049 RepID=UPI003F81DB22